jgi:hypothetical protein
VRRKLRQPRRLGRLAASRPGPEPSRRPPGLALHPASPRPHPQYYLRTSEIRFLHESYVFYEAIRSRSYFAASASDANLAIKQLRYFARFIIICLLLNRREEVWQLLQEFQALISSYTMKFSPPDAGEWRAVISEVTTFLNADVAMPVPRSPGASLPFRASLRCSPGAPEVKLAPHRTLLLHAVMASYYPRQVGGVGGRAGWRQGQGQGQGQEQGVTQGKGVRGGTWGCQTGLCTRRLNDGQARPAFPRADCRPPPAAPCACSHGPWLGPHPLTRAVGPPPPRPAPPAARPGQNRGAASG